MNSLPFFPTQDGGATEKSKVVESLEYLHERAGLAIVDEDGTNLLGGHSLRLAGARHLTATGLHVYQVELMTRWNSPMLLHFSTMPSQRHSPKLPRNTLQQFRTPMLRRPWNK